MSAPTPRPVAADRAVIQISRPVHKRLAKIKTAQQRQLKRQVSFTEIIEQLLDQSQYRWVE